MYSTPAAQRLFQGGRIRPRNLLLMNKKFRKPILSKFYHFSSTLFGGGGGGGGNAALACTMLCYFATEKMQLRRQRQIFHLHTVVYKRFKPKKIRIYLFVARFVELFLCRVREYKLRMRVGICLVRQGRAGNRLDTVKGEYNPV